MSLFLDVLKYVGCGILGYSGRLMQDWLAFKRNKLKEDHKAKNILIEETYQLLDSLDTKVNSLGAIILHMKTNGAVTQADYLIDKEKKSIDQISRLKYLIDFEFKMPEEILESFRKFEDLINEGLHIATYKLLKPTGLVGDNDQNKLIEQFVTSNSNGSYENAIYAFKTLAQEESLKLKDLVKNRLSDEKKNLKKENFF